MSALSESEWAELLPGEGWLMIKWNYFIKVQIPEKRVAYEKEVMISSPAGEWAGADSQKA